MIKSCAIRWVVVALAVIVGLPLGYYFFIIDWEGRPFCHRQIEGAFQQWMIESKTDAYPNIGGRSRESLAAIREMMKSMNWSENYNYVPGLRQGDPPDLVLLYVNRSTRWNWHGKHPTIFERKAWILVPSESPRSVERPGMELGELSERVSLEEFRARLRRTLDFVRTNERPNWQAVIDEHTKFLESIERQKP